MRGALCVSLIFICARFAGVHERCSPGCEISLGHIVWERLPAVRVRSRCFVKEEENYALFVEYSHYKCQGLIT